MSYNPGYEASKALPTELIAKQLEDFAASGHDLSGRCFSHSPPSVSSVATTTFGNGQGESPGTALQTKETSDRMNSTANTQFTIQTVDEMARLRTARDKGLLQVANFGFWEDDLWDAAEANIQYRWMQQGIWDERWSRGRDQFPDKKWRHELREPLPPVEPSKSVEDGGAAALNRKRKRRQSDVEKEYEETVRHAIDFQNRQLSRPCFQFVYQIFQELKWIRMGLSEGHQDQHASLDMRAYENVKSRWIRDGIWDDDWTFIPGTSWRHERAHKFPLSHECQRILDAKRVARTERAERPPRWYFMAPIVEKRRKPPFFPESRPTSSSEAVSSSSSRRSSRPASKGMQSQRDRCNTSQTPDTSAKKKKKHSKDPINSVSASRPRRAAALKAMEAFRHGT